ncbi:hypothetical protein KDW41_04420 [Burkholderia vietnamiensis]|nr:hypothetical protein [Burkholderia vietnamiensis]
MVTRKETIKPPTAKELKDAGKQLPKGHSSAGRTMADKSVAVKQGVAAPKKKMKLQAMQRETEVR